MSDLHLEFPSAKAPSWMNGDLPDVVVLAGDVHRGKKGIEWAESEFAQLPVVYVAGNHEFYKGDWDRTLEKLRTAARGSNVLFLEDETATVGGVRFIGASLWTDFNLLGAERQADLMDTASNFMNDFRLIRFGPRHRPLTPAATVRRFETSRNFIRDEAGRLFSGPTVVVTHHLPLRSSVAQRFESTPLIAAYASDLSELITTAQPALWIHGHTHDSFDYQVGGTRVLCNPRGYPKASNSGYENRAFEERLIVDL